MITYQRINTELSDQSLETYTPTPEGVAMGGAPNWAVLLDPDYHTQLSIRNRVVKNSLIPLATSGLTLESALVSGNRYFRPSSNSAARVRPNVTISDTAWSVVFVAKPAAKSDANKHGIVTGDLSGTDKGKTISVGFSPSGKTIIVSQYGSVADVGRVLSFSHETGSYSDSVNVFVVTFSTKNGVSIRVNGELKGASETETAKAPTTAQVDAGEWSCFNYVQGQFGMLGILNSDLSDAKNKPHLDSIEQFLMSKYGITTP